MAKINTWQQALDYIYARLPMYHRLGPSAYKKDLTNTILLCQACGDPHLKLKTIHIAGTNGKGTTTHIIAAGLQSQGYQVGVYTSPHYKDFRERIKINGNYIPKKYVINFINTFQHDIEVIQPSFFEVTVAMTFRYFADMKVDYAVIETGLGGRLDSTNVILPLISIITNISFDHQSMLGYTLPEIAGEKAGIIKNKIPVVIGETQSEIIHIFDEKAASMEANISYADKHVFLQKIKSENTSLEYDVYCDKKLWIKGLVTDLIGPFQEKNIITGLYALKVLAKFIKIDFDAFKTFFPALTTQTRYMGRWQILQKSPLVIADSAHNVAGLQIVTDALKKMDYNKWHFIVGFVNDKDISAILHLLPKDATYYFVKANIPRGLPSDTLRSLAKEHDLDGKAYSTVRQGYAAALKKAHANDLVFVGGSIFVVAEVL
jgi:dihydrofolate synthase/folylpolyglutamate synthase